MVRWVTNCAFTCFLFEVGFAGGGEGGFAGGGMATSAGVTSVELVDPPCQSFHEWLKPFW